MHKIIHLVRLRSIGSRIAVSVIALMMLAVGVIGNRRNSARSPSRSD